MPKNTSVMGIYPDHATVSDAISVLQKEGYRAADISTLSANNQGTKDFALEKHNKAAEGAATGAAIGASLGAAWFPRGAGLGLWVLGAGDQARLIAVGAHQARWRRWTASLEIAQRWARGGFTIDAHGGPTLGWLTTEGVDYDQNRSDSAVSLGATAGIRTAWWASRHAAFWIDVRGFSFPGRDSVYGGTGATADEASLPRWGAIASFGAAVGRAPRAR